jgi:hypothetical protein
MQSSLLGVAAKKAGLTAAAHKAYCMEKIAG